MYKYSNGRLCHKKIQTIHTPKNKTNKLAISIIMFATDYHYSPYSDALVSIFVSAASVQTIISSTGNPSRAFNVW